MQRLEASAICHSYGKRALMLVSKNDASCPYLSYLPYWETFLGSNSVRILVSETMSHRDITELFLGGHRRAEPHQQTEDDNFARALQHYLTPHTQSP